MVDFKEELIRYSLNEDGYFLHIVAKDLPQLFEKSKAEGIVDLDFSHRNLLKIIVKQNDTEKRKNLPYGSKAARCIISSLLATGYHKLLEKPVKLEDFKAYTSEAFKEYCSTRNLDEEIARKLKNLSVSGREVGNSIRKGWFKMLYDVENDKIKLKCGLRNVTPPNV